MLRANLTALTVSLFIGLLSAAGLKAQEQPAQAAPHNLAIQVVGRPHNSPMPVLESPSDGGFMESVPPPRLPNWKQPAGTPPLTRVRLRYNYEGAGVRINAAVVFDDSEAIDPPGPKYGPKEQALGSYFAQEGETVTLSELARFGFAPMALKIVKAVPRETESVPPLPPLLDNPLKSVTVVSFECDTQSTSACRMLLRNLANKNIIALDVYSEHAGGRNSQSVEGTPAAPLIAPGATYENRISVSLGGQGGRMTPQGFVPDAPQQRTVVLGTVVFADDTYEGEVNKAAEVIARRRGRQLQLARVVTLLQNTAEAQEQDSTSTLDKLKAQVSSLRIDADAALVDELLARFPELSKEYGRTLIVQEVMSGLKYGREEAVRQLAEIENVRARNPQGFNFQQMLRAVREQLEQRSAPR